MPLPSLNPNRLEQKSGGGALSWFGLPFFLAGLAVITLSFIPREIRGGDEFPWYIGIPFGGIFAAVGGILIFGRAGFIIDRQKKEVIKWWGLLRPMRSKTYPLEQFEFVSLKREVRRSDKSTYTVFPIRLAGPTSKDLDVSEPRDENQARLESENIAKFLNIPIHDETAGELRIRNADTLDLSIKDKFRMGSESNKIPDIPSNLKAHIEYSGNILKVRIPPSGFHPFLIIPIAAIGIFEAIILSTFVLPLIKDGDGPPIVIFAIFGLFSLIPIVIVGSILGKAFLSKELVEVTPQHIEVRKGWPKIKTVTIPCQELEELFLANANTAGSNRRQAAWAKSKNQIQAISDNRSIRFAGSLSEEEKTYILALAKAVIVS